MRALIAACALFVFGVSPVLAQQEIYIGVAAKSGRDGRVRIGLEDFAPRTPSDPAERELAARMKDVLRADLLFSRYFEVLEKLPGDKAAQEPDYWKKSGAAYLLGGTVRQVKDGKWVMTAELRNADSGDPITQKGYRGLPVNERAAAHRLADEIIWRLTGKKGIAHSKIAFSNDSTGHKEIYVVDYDGQGLVRLTADKSINLLPRWSVDGSRLYYTTYRYGNPDSFEIDLAQQKIRPFSVFQGLNIAGGFSPDGKELAMTLSRGRDPSIYIVAPDKKEAKKLTSSSGVDSSASYSPDGRFVTFISDRSGNPQVYTVELATGKTQRLTRLNWCDSPRWSPTGEWIVFAGRQKYSDDIDIFLTDVTGGQLRQITRDSGKNEDPSWSPDGRFISFTSTRGGGRQIYVMDADGSAPHLVSKLPGLSYTPSWGP
ncbi:MAG: hypothetical protein GX410_09590 [Elusimicrobia bacterium]|nr:hypothetical protein [Elusimicrobiota bacterium]